MLGPAGCLDEGAAVSKSERTYLVHLSLRILFPGTIDIFLDLAVVRPANTFGFLSFAEGLLIGFHILETTFE